MRRLWDSVVPHVDVVLAMAAGDAGIEGTFIVCLMGGVGVGEVVHVQGGRS